MRWSICFYVIPLCGWVRGDALAVVESVARNAEITFEGDRSDGTRIIKAQGLTGQVTLRFAPHTGLLRAVGSNFSLVVYKDEKLFKDGSNILQEDLKSQSFTIMAQPRNEEVMLNANSIVVCLFRKKMRTRVKVASLLKIVSKASQRPLEMAIGNGSYSILLLRIGTVVISESEEETKPLRFLSVVSSDDWPESAKDSSRLLKTWGSSSNNGPFVMAKLNKSGRGGKFTAKDGAMAYGSLRGELLDWVPKGFEHCLIRPAAKQTFRAEELLPKTILTLLIPNSHPSDWSEGEEPAAFHFYLPFFYVESVQEFEETASALATEFCPRKHVKCLFAYIDEA